MKLDNAAKIYPAARSRRWINVFRISATFKDKIDKDILQSALDNTIKRFPSVAVRIKNGMFWYYLESIEKAPKVVPEMPYPCTRMSERDISRCAFRVLYYENRVSFELFHAITDGNGALVFLKTLAAEYTHLRYGENVPPTNGVLDITEEPDEGELEDSFVKNSGDITISRHEDNAFRLTGTRINDEYLHITTGIIDVERIKSVARSYGVSLTAFLTAVMIYSVNEIQAKKTPKVSKRKPVKVLVPVNLRNYFNSNSLRNFAYFISPGIHPETGDFSFDEILKAVYYQMGSELTQKRLRARINTNVKSEKAFFLKIMPLFIKNFAMKMIYNVVGEKTTSVTISNLGVIKLPEEMERHIDRMDFVLGILAHTVYNCSALTYKDKLYFTFTKNIYESELERIFFSFLVNLGINVTIEHNQRL